MIYILDIRFVLNKSTESERFKLNSIKLQKITMISVMVHIMYYIIVWSGCICGDVGGDVLYHPSNIPIFGWTIGQHSFINLFHNFTLQSIYIVYINHIHLPSLEMINITQSVYI